MKRLVEHGQFDHFSKEHQAGFKQFVEDGFMVLKNFFSEAEVDQHNAIIDKLLGTGKVDFNYTGRKINEAYLLDPYIDQQFFRNPQLLEILHFLLGKKTRNVGVTVIMFYDFVLLFFLRASE